MYTVLTALIPLLRHSWSPVDYNYDALTDEERALVSREDFEALVVAVRPPVGHVVRSRVDIWDVDTNDERYQHATVGGIGVIIGYYRGPGDHVPTVDWSAGTGVGVYDVGWENLTVVGAEPDEAGYARLAKLRSPEQYAEDEARLGELGKDWPHAADRLKYLRAFNPYTRATKEAK